MSRTTAYNLPNRFHAVRYLGCFHLRVTMDTRGHMAFHYLRAKFLEREFLSICSFESQGMFCQKDPRKLMRIFRVLRRVPCGLFATGLRIW